MNLKQNVLTVANAYKGELNTDPSIKDVYPSLTIDPIQIKINENDTDTCTVTLTLFDWWPKGCLSMADVYAYVGDDVDKYSTLLRAMIEQLCKRFKYRQTGQIQIDQFPYNLTEHQLYAVRIQAQLVKPSPGDCCLDDWFDLAQLPKKSWNEQVG